ncbi:MAG: UDP-3-O-(3-hydroxymyristoyl)glucosamine N-acyltransferase [Burkholderiaceae bacterium]
MRALDDPFALHELAAALGIPVEPAWRDVRVLRLAPLDAAAPGDLSFLSDSRYLPALERSKASAVMLRAEHLSRLPAGCAPLVLEDPYLGFATVAGLMQARSRPHSALAGIDPSARVEPSARIGADVHIGANAVLGARAQIGPGAVIGPNCVIGDNVVIGARSRLVAQVCVYFDCQIGVDCLIHAGTVVGSDGFGFARDGAGWRKIPQLGSVVIGDRVEIGANCALDRGALEDTVVGDDCILDNLIQVAHNVRIGAGSAIAGCVGIAGSATLGKRCLIGGGAGILGHLELADDVIVSPMSLVTRSVRRAGFYSGTFPLMDNAQWEKAAATLRHLPDLRARLRALEKLTRTSP